MAIRAKDELTALEAAGRVVAKALAAVKAAVRPGVTTGELDAIAACVRSAFARAFRVARAGVPIRRIGREVGDEAKRFGLAVVPELSGHGIGRTIHEAPTVPNFDDPLAFRRLEEGMVIAVEPIVAAGSGGSYVARDGWTVRTADRALAAHHEHTIVITRGRPIVLTRS